MSKKSENTNRSEKIEYNNYQIKNFKKYYKNYHHNEIETYNKINWCESEIDSLNIEINNFREIIKKTKEYFLLELESSTDKHQQIKLQNENIYSNLINFLKKDNTNKISSLSEEIGKYKYEISEKNKHVENLNNLLANRNNQINILNEKISEITSLNELKLNKIIEENKNKIKELTEELNEIKTNLNKKEKQNKILTDENNIFKLNLEEKDEQIKSLKEEIKILNSTIEEKDKTLKSFGVISNE